MTKIFKKNKKLLKQATCPPNSIINCNTYHIFHDIISMSLQRYWHNIYLFFKTTQPLNDKYTSYYNISLALSVKKRIGCNVESLKWGKKIYFHFSVFEWLNDGREKKKRRPSNEG